MMQTVSQGQGSAGSPVLAPAAPAAPAAPRAPLPIPRGGGRITVEEDGDRTHYTFTSVPPQMMYIAHRAQQTAFGLMGMLAAIVILGPFARMWARRIEKSGDMKAARAAGQNAELLQQQLLQLQQSVDAMSVEVERISESQRFQSRLLHEKQSV